MQGSLERLGALRSLTELRLRDVGLTELSWSADSSLAPPWPRLRILQVDDNKLTELPSWLTHLTLLEELDVSGNELSQLPTFDADHSRRADLANQLKGLGFHSELRRLLEAQGLQPPVPLKSLYVQCNLLTALPLSLADIRGTLTTLVANPQKDPRATGDGGRLRPLRVPPEEVLAKPIEAVFGFLEALRETGEQTRTVMKVSFVGEGGAGKTHMCLALQGGLERYRYDDPETVGIDIGGWVAKSDESGKAPVYCRSWDFAGQASYRAVHQLFFTRGRSLYILLLDLTKVLRLRGVELRRAVMARMAFWVESLLARAPGAAVKVVLSKSDSLSAKERVELAGMRNVVLSCLEELVAGFLEALKTERDMLKASTGRTGLNVEGWERERRRERLKELDAAIASGGLEYSKAEADILLIGIPPLETNDGLFGAESAHERALPGNDQPDESMWDRVVVELESPEAEPSQQGEQLLPGQPASFVSGVVQNVGGQLFATARDFQAAIVDLAAQNDSFTITFPANWVQLIEWVEGEREAGSEVCEHPTTGSIEWQAYAKELSGDGNLFSSERSLRDATEVLHDLGYLLYYGGDGALGKHVFLHPQKVIDLLKVVVQHNFAEKIKYVASNNLIGMNVGGRKRFQELTSTFLETGQLDHRMLPQMWPGILDWSLYKALLELLERFDLAYCSEDSNPEDDVWGSHGVPSRWPDIPRQSLAAMFPLLGTRVVSRRLHFDRLLPQGIFEQLLVRCLGLEELSLDQGRKALWRSKEAWGSGACLDCEGEVCVLLLMTRDSDQSGDLETVVGLGGVGELPGSIFVMAWDSRRDTNPILRNVQSNRPFKAVCKVLGALVPLLKTRFPGVRFEEEVICHEHAWQVGWSNIDLMKANGGEQLELQDILFRGIVSSIRDSTGWRSLQKRRKRWRCGTCQQEHDASTFGGQCVGESLGSHKGQDAFLLTPTGVLPEFRSLTPRTPGSEAMVPRPLPTTVDVAGSPSLQPYTTVDWPYDVFISHAGTLKPLACELEEDLRTLGFEAFVDKTALHPGDSADARMLRSAQTTPIGLALLNRDFVVREWPLAELKLIVAAGTLLPVVVGMSHTEFKRAWQASSEATGLGEVIFREVIRTTSVVDEGGWQRPLREKICFAILRVFVEKVCPRLPDRIASMRHVERALAAAGGVAAHRILHSLNGRDYKAAAEWVTHLENIRALRIPVGTAPPSRSYLDT